MVFVSATYISLRVPPTNGGPGTFSCIASAQKACLTAKSLLDAQAVAVLPLTVIRTHLIEIKLVAISKI